MSVRTSLGAGLLASAFACGVAGGARAEPIAQHHAGQPLGKVEFATSCTAEAQPAFERGLALLHHMTYPQAREAFEQAVAADPRCAIAHWGVAMTLFQPLWPTRPGPDALQRGWEHAQRAQALERPTQREALLVDAVAAFFAPPASTDYWARISRWEQAMARAHEALPDDPEVAAFYALAHLATTPADRITRANADRAAEILLKVHARNPDHPGASHYLVHANDVPGREHESIEITRAYDAGAPRNPHALHMPTHIYTRLGDWDGVVRGNLAAAEAALEHPAGDRGQYVWDEFAHAIEYLVYAYLQQGRDGAAAAQLARLRDTANIEPSFKTAFHVASTQARYALERRDWAAAARIVPRAPATLDWDRFGWPEAIAQFARGLGAVHTRDADAAASARERLDALAAASDTAGEKLFARNIRVLALELRAWMAQAAGDHDDALALMREATELESSTPKHAVTPGPTLPAHEQLGDLLMAQGDAAAAHVAYEAALARYPNRFNALLGAARAARASGDAAAATRHYAALRALAGDGDRTAPLREAADANAAPAVARARILGIEHKVPTVSAHDKSSIDLYLWEKRDGKIEPDQFARTNRVVLLVHGATIPGRPDFDLQFPPDENGLTYSLMDRLAAEGFDVFSVDIQNYGGSDRVPCGLCVTSQVAANDIGAAVDHIRKLRGVDRVDLLGWSWGATTAGLFAQQHPEKVRRLVQYALYLGHSKQGATAPTEEFRPVDIEKCCREDFVADATDPGVFEAYAREALKWEQRAPNGIIKDVLTRMPLLDPTRIRVPTLMIYGALDTVCRIDQPELPAFFRDLATDDKSLVIVPNGGHALLLEQQRDRFHTEVLAWLAHDEPRSKEDRP
ncbi:MAG TPA: alpha/beta fold hydrolase [Xanthomonadales bacterium]|nr:alpha/beta fold hydrolase [Xanthomonadales bacterium]